MVVKRLDWTIRKRMILLLIPAILVVLSMATIFSLQLSSAAQKDAAYDETLNSARAYAHEFNTGMSDNLAQSGTFSSVLGQNTGMTREDLLDVQRSLLEDNPMAIGIGVIFEPGAFDGQDSRYAGAPGHDANGRFAAYWNRLNGTESLIPVVDIETSDWYTIPKRTKKAIVMEPQPYEDVLMTSYITPIIKNKTFAGTVGIDVPLDNLDRTVSRVKVFDTGYAFLVSNTGIFVSSPKKEYIGRMSLDELGREQNNPGLSAMAENIRQGREGYTGMTDPFTGRNVVMFYSPIRTGNWSMVVVAPTDEMLAGVTTIGRVMLLISFLSIVITGFIILIVARNLSEPIVAMSRMADRVASGDLDVHVPDMGGELGVLSRAFNNMAARMRELIIRLEAKVTELQDTRAALLESEEHYRHLIENSHDIIYTLNTEGVITFVSPSWTMLLGYEVPEVIGKSIRQFIHPDDLGRCMEYLQAIIRTGDRQTGVEYRTLHADGSWHWHTTNAVPLRNKDGLITGIEGSASDITGRRETDEALRQANERLRSYIDANVAGVILASPSGKIIDANDYYLQTIGYTREEFGQGRVNWRNITPPEWLTADEHALEELRKWGRCTQYEKEYIRKDGTRVPVILSNAMMPGEEEQIVSFVLDITERKKAEDTLLRVNQKLNVLSQLTRKDLTSQIFVLNSYLELAKHQSEGKEKITGILQKSVQEIRLIQDTIEYSKDYQEMGAKPPKWQNVKMAMLFGLSHISIGNIRHSLETGDLEIFADPLLEKVCQRLFENSVKHGDHVTLIRVGYTFTPEGMTIIFEDDGCGIPLDRKEQIFLRSEGPHTSMRSLIFVREILDITGIMIKETGEPGTGARFEMTVPKGMWRMEGKDTV